MTDIYLYAGEPNPNDVRLRDPTVADGGGAPPITGSGDVTCAVAAFAGSGELTFAGVGSVASEAVGLSASGLETFTGMASEQSAVSALSGTGVETFTGAGDVASGAALLSATGQEAFTATGDVASGVASMAGDGVETFLGSAAMSEPPSTFEASGSSDQPEQPPPDTTVFTAPTYSFGGSTWGSIVRLPQTVPTSYQRPPAVTGSAGMVAPRAELSGQGFIENPPPVWVDPEDEEAIGTLMLAYA